MLAAPRGHFVNTLGQEVRCCGLGHTGGGKASKARAVGPPDANRACAPSRRDCNPQPWYPPQLKWRAHYQSRAQALVASLASAAAPANTIPHVVTPVAQRRAMSTEASPPPCPGPIPGHGAPVMPGAPPMLALFGRTGRTGVAPTAPRLRGGNGLSGNAFTQLAGVGKGPEAACHLRAVKDVVEQPASKLLWKLQLERPPRAIRAKT